MKPEMTTGDKNNHDGIFAFTHGLLDAANRLKYVQHVRRYFCA
jgi:hypothetical protein